MGFERGQVLCAFIFSRVDQTPVWKPDACRVIRNWKRRWLVLSGTELRYYSDKCSTVPKGVLNIVQGDVQMMGESKARPADTVTGVTVVTRQANKRVFNFCTATDADGVEWHAALCRAVTMSWPLGARPRSLPFVFGAGKVIKDPIPPHDVLDKSFAGGFDFSMHHHPCDRRLDVFAS